MSGGAGFAIRGRFVHGLPPRLGTPPPGPLQYVTDGFVVVGADGTVKTFATTPEAAEAAAASLPPGTDVLQLEPNELCAPGLVDTHVHAPQQQFCGTATDLPLMQWLQKHTFPAERRCADTALARRVYEKLVARLLANGTTTAVYFGSIHVEATCALADVCLAHGQRAFVGKVAMDRHGGKDYVETTEQALRGTEALIEHVYAAQPGESDPATRLVNPVITPRFVPTCTPALLRGLGAMAEKHRRSGVWVQSHIAESPDEEAFVEALHPGRRDAQIFAEAGLLSNRCVMAHGVWLRPPELAMLAARGTGLACCPLSNMFFAGGDLRLRAVQALGVRCGLGTDVAGGYSSSMLSTCRHVVLAGKVVGRAATEPGDDEVTCEQAFWTATLGGAMALGLEATLGNFELGKQFDAILVRMGEGAYDPLAGEARPAGPIEALAADFEQFVNLGDDRNVARVWVRGREVGGRGAK